MATKQPEPAKESRPNVAKNDSAKDSERQYETLHLDSNPPTSEGDPEYFVREGRETAERNHKAEQEGHTNSAS